MPFRPSPVLRHLLLHPVDFAGRVLTAFRANQGILLAGAVAYYALLSILPLFIVTAIGFSHLFARDELLVVLGHYLEWLMPGQSQAILADVADFLAYRTRVGIVLAGTLLFFSSLAFSVLQKALDIIFAKRPRCRPRHFLVAAVLPYGLVLLACCALLLLTTVSLLVETFAGDRLVLFGVAWPLAGAGGLLIYLFGFACEVVLLAAIYQILPPGRTQPGHALIGGFAAASLWEIVRRALHWYFATLSHASVVYGSLTTAVVALFSLECAAALLLLGAQVIAEYEKQGEEADPTTGN